jgi:pimeloyl-ACP methyl ester carboxylesterase
MRFREGNGPPLVLLHGLGGTWRVWEPLLPALTARYEVLALTLPGHFGAQPWSSAENLAEVVARQLDEEGMAEAHLVGNSLGGSIVLELARRGRALSVIAFSPIGLIEPLEEIRLKRRLRNSHRLASRIRPLARRLARFRAGRKLLFADVVCDAGRLSPDEANQWFDAFVGCAAFHEILDLPVAPAPGGLECSVCIAWSSEDRMTPEKPFADRFARALPKAARARIVGAGHVPMPDAPERVLEVILEHARN